MDHIIKVENLVKDYAVGKRSVRILKSLNFDVQPGEFVMISGPSGCGKSTLMNILNSWEEPTSGSVMVNGVNFFTLKERNRVKNLRSSIGMMSQAAFWVKSLSVLDNITIPLLLAGHSKSYTKKRGVELLEILGLERFAGYKPMDLSGGQQQRISFLRSIINNPKVLLADEPTGNLDSRASDLMIKLFSTLNGSLGRTVVMVTHNPELLNYASKTIYMKDGQILKIDSRKQAKHKIQDNSQDIVELAKANFSHLIDDYKDDDLGDNK